jgi:hypothetical protein
MPLPRRFQPAQANSRGFLRFLRTFRIFCSGVAERGLRQYKTRLRKK